MVWDVTFSCDICGKSKGEANHWWMALLPPLAEEKKLPLPAGRFTLMRWSRSESQSEDMYHLCGQGCALQAMERFMTEGAIDAG